MEDYKTKYEKAIEQAKKELQTCGSLDCDAARQIFRFFPELKESEDERIRKEIIQFLQLSHPQFIGKRNQEDWIAWLEKQCEQQNKVFIWKHWKDGIAGNGEDKPIFLIKNGDTYSLSSCLGYECDYIELSELNKLLPSKKQDEQKPAWSEEDEKMLQQITQYLISLSEECEVDLNDKLNWLKSIKERYTWKPSDEQMRELGIVATGMGWFNKDVLSGLLEQLKKLREE